MGEKKMTFSYWLPIFIVVLGNVFYHICTKVMPEMNTFASLTVVYGVAMVASFVLFFVTCKDSTLTAEYAKLNWAPIVLGLAIIALEGGAILYYRVGWDISAANTTQSGILAVLLLIIGFLVFKETITVTRIVGTVIALTGLYLINK